MRLINTSTRELRTFFAEAVPNYAILSHRWNEKEVSLQDLQDGRGEKMPEYSKIERCCVQAQLDGLQYVWIDSCCIDKTSSAELSEAINSMYQWYKDSELCYAYLGDVRHGDKLHHALRKSNWFTRGWTLQELLAPSTVVFFDQNWNDIGTKGSLEEVISKITGIDDFINFETACVAQKMSWASQRETTRVEDMAYCLLGLFNVNMPPLYGEGEKAFMRLQMEILKTSDDESIFAWYKDGFEGDLSGLLASSPRQFKHSKNIRLPKRNSHGDHPLREHNYPFSITNKGLYISLRLLPSRVSFQFIAPLNCSWLSNKGESGGYPAIHLQRDVINGLERYSRALDEKLTLLSYDELRHKLQASKESINRYIYVKEEPSGHSRPATSWYWWSFLISIAPLKDYGFVLSDYDTRTADCIWNHSRQNEVSLVIESKWKMATGILFRNDKTRESVALVIVIGECRCPWLIVLTPEHHQELTTILSDIEHKTSSNWKGPKAMTKSNTTVASSSSSGHEMFIGNQTPILRTRPPLDRMSRQLKDGKSVSASLRKSKDEDIYFRDKGFIHLEIDSKGSLRWPAPVWVDELVLSKAVKEREWKEHNPGTSNSKRIKKHRRRSASVVSSEHTDSNTRQENKRGFERLIPRRVRVRARDGHKNESQQVPHPFREDTRGYRRP